MQKLLSRRVSKGDTCTLQDEILRRAVAFHVGKNWKQICESLPAAGSSSNQAAELVVTDLTTIAFILKTFVKHDPPIFAKLAIPAPLVVFPCRALMLLRLK